MATTNVNVTAASNKKRTVERLKLKKTDDRPNHSVSAKDAQSQAMQCGLGVTVRDSTSGRSFILVGHPDEVSLMRTWIRRQSAGISASVSSINDGCQVDGSKPDEIKDICSFFLVEQCSYSARCGNLHYIFPFQWQFYDKGTKIWDDFEMEYNCRTEESYCNPDCDKVRLEGSFTINFDRMSVTFHAKEGDLQTKIRRLSTKNAASTPDKLPFLTKWNWFWQMDTGGFLKYDHDEVIEEKYLAEPSGEMVVNSDSFTYHICFSRMLQVNQTSKRGRKIRRRPSLYVNGKMIQAETLKEKRQNPNFRVDFPATWDSLDTNSNGFHLVPIAKRGKTLQEYEEIEALFFETMDQKNFTIKKIQRIQNIDLYIGFKYYKNKMLRRLSTVEVGERRLFHGTKEKLIDAICHQGFDFRVSGSTTGCLYGKGSYFAKEATYSKDYTDSKQLFVAKVLIGHATKGESQYTRPPLKDPSKPHGDAYDSCVNNLQNPTIFVVFSIEQAYPEYLVDYVLHRSWHQT